MFRTSVSVALFLGMCAAPLAEAARQLTVDDALALGLKQSPDLHATQLQAEAAEDRAKSVRGHLLPLINLQEEYQHYDKPFAISFPLGPNAPAAAFVARKQDTNSFVAAADQPILGLFHIVPDYMAAGAAAEASSYDAKTATSALREGVRAGFLRYFEAKSAEAIAKASEDQLAEQIQVTDAKFKAGTVTNADVLRIKVAAANARQQEIFAQAQAQVVKANVLAIIGLRANDPNVELVEPTQLESQAAAASAPAFDDARASAFKLRPEIMAAHAQATAAAHTRTARWFNLLPEADLEGAYVRVDGQVFAPKQSWFIGVKASWTIWEWGADFYAGRAAGAQADAAASLAQARADQVEVDVATKLCNLTAVQSALDAAQTAIASAEEAYRVTQALVKAGTATTTDLLDSQSALTTSRQNLNRATYERAIAQVALQRTTGQD